MLPFQIARLYDHTLISLDRIYLTVIKCLKVIICQEAFESGDEITRTACLGDDAYGNDTTRSNGSMYAYKNSASIGHNVVRIQFSSATLASYEDHEIFQKGTCSTTQ